MPSSPYKSFIKFLTLCGILLFAAGILMFGLYVKNGPEAWHNGHLMSDTLELAIEPPAFDLNQADEIAKEINKSQEKHKPKKFIKKDGQISPFDSLFVIYADSVAWDWRMLAAIAYVESHFNPDAVSKGGARGLMQLMPRTARNFGCPDSLMNDPESNLKAGVRLLADLEKKLKRKNVEEDLVYFTLAGYNAGLGHIYDAITLADSLGYNPTKWYGNVEECLRKKADPEYYNLPYLRLGRYNGNGAVRYVQEVLDYFEVFKNAN